MLQTVSRASQFGVPPVTAPPMTLFRSLMAGTGLSLALCAAPPAFAQDDPVIVVTGSGLEETPAAPAYDTQVIDRDQLVSVPSGRIEDALSAVAGFQQFRRSDSRSANASAQGATLRALSRFLRHPLGEHIVGVFVDFACLHQAPRSAEQEAAFKAALRVMPNGFASPLCTTRVTGPTHRRHRPLLSLLPP